MHRYSHKTLGLFLGACLVSVSSISLGLPSPSGDWQAWNRYIADSGKAPMMRQDIVDIAASSGDFETLVTAVKKAGLVEVLKGDGPFTVFAPTDEAFAKVPKDKLEALLADPEALKQVLKYHVVAGRVTARDVAGLSSAKTVQGQSVDIDTSSGVRVDNANVIKTDIMASNGVIHVIDSVILPN